MKWERRFDCGCGVGAVIGLHALRIDAVDGLTVNVGHGSVHTAHGLLPVPAPATLELLKAIRPMRHYSQGIHSHGARLSRHWAAVLAAPVDAR